MNYIKTIELILSNPANIITKTDRDQLETMMKHMKLTCNHPFECVVSCGTKHHCVKCRKDIN